jgi:mRNA-degrading endonuclease RelE of RelBE toxin-antitoxin system
MTDQQWSIELTPSARRDLNRLDQQVRRRVYTALQRLAADPRQAAGVRRSESDWRI